MLIIVCTSILISIIFAPLGCLSLWKRYTYFTDGFAHASVLAGSISLICNIPLLYSGILFAILFALVIFKYRNIFDGNVIVGLMANFMLSMALIISYFAPTAVDINLLLFGDLISASINDIMILFWIMVTVIAFFMVFYKQIILVVINRDLAQIMGIKVKLIELLFLILLSISVFSTLKIVGALLVSGMLLIPTVIARLFTITPKQMIITAIIISVVLTLLGLSISFYLDTPVAPVIICVGVITYFVTYSFNLYRLR
jgi:zinc transport system permease protein